MAIVPDFAKVAELRHSVAKHRPEVALAIMRQTTSLQTDCLQSMSNRELGCSTEQLGHGANLREQLSGEVSRMENALVIVDDDMDVVQVLQLLLEMDGYRVLPAVTAQAALDLVEQHSPLAVLLDLGMPLMNGLELARQLRARHGPDLPLIAVTGWSDPEKREEALVAGVDHVFVKPVDPDTLRKIFPPIAAGLSP